MATLQGLDLLSLSSCRGSIPTHCRTSIPLQGFSWFSSDCTKHFRRLQLWFSALQTKVDWLITYLWDMNGVRLPVECGCVIVHVSNLDVDCVFHHLRGGNTLVKNLSRASPTCFLSSWQKKKKEKKTGVTKNMHQPHQAETRNERNSGRACEILPAGQSRLNVSTFQRLKLRRLRQVSGWLFVWKAEIRARNEGKSQRERDRRRGSSGRGSTWSGGAQVSAMYGGKCRDCKPVSYLLDVAHVELHLHLRRGLVSETSA